MKTEFWVCGRTKQDFILSGTHFYLQRIRNLSDFVYLELEGKKTVNREEMIRSETELIMKNVKANDIVILLDERGKMFSSTEFAGLINDYFCRTSGRLIFVAGGAYGFSTEIYQRADNLLSLSRMTFPHELVRVIFLEQFYRALTILKHHPYHH